MSSPVDVSNSRTDKGRVIAVLTGGRDYDTKRNPNLDEYIAVGMSKISQLILDCGYYAIPVPDDATLATLETWIAAWAYKCSDQQFASTTVISSAAFKGQTGMGLESNHYGQTAIELDPTGLLQTKRKGGLVVAGWTGKRPSEQIPYNQRN